MQNVAEAIERRTSDLTTPDFREVAIKWAGFTLKNQTDELLHKALALAEALALYQDEFEKCTGIPISRNCL